MWRRLKLEPLMWGTGTVVAAVIVGLVWLLGDDVQVGLDQVVAGIGFTLVLGWGIGRWMQGRPAGSEPDASRLAEPADLAAGPPPAGCLPTLVIVGFLAAVLHLLYGRVLLGVFPQLVLHFGTTERLMLAPAIIFALYAATRRLNLHRLLSILAAAVIAIGWASETGDLDLDAQQRSEVRSSALATAVRTGEPFVLAQQSGIAPTKPVDAAACATTRIAYEERTLLGMRNRRIDAQTQACWNADHHVIWLETDEHARAESAPGGVQAVRPASVSIFGLGIPFGDDVLPPPRVDGSDADRKLSTILARVRRSHGRDVVELAAAYWWPEKLGPGLADGEDSITDGNTPLRSFPFVVPNGGAVDLVSAHLEPGDAHTTITRFTNGSQRKLTTN